VNFDAAGEPKTWPKKDVVGIAEFLFQLDDGHIEVQNAFVLSTYEDMNNFRLNDLLNHLVNRLIPGKQLMIYNSSNGQAKAQLVVLNGTQVAPPLSMETRTVQPVMVRMLSDQILRA
jgi:hypothetical protein